MLGKITALWLSLTQQRLSLRLLKWVVICSSFFALFVSAFQLYTDYRRDVSSIHSSMQFINDSYLKTLSANAYNMDIQQLELQLQGMLKLQDIKYLEIIEKTENSNVLLAKQGDPNSSKDIEREFTLNYFPSDLPLGTVPYSILHVSASLKGVYQRLWDKAIIIIVSNMTKTFAASISIFFIFQFLITGHLKTIARFTEQLNLNNLGMPLDLDRKPSDPTKQDELDQLVFSINNMQEKLVEDIDERKQVEKALTESERKNRAWLEKSIVCTKILDLDFNLQYMSSAGVEALNVEDITLHYGKPYPFDFYPELFKTTMTESLKRAIDKNEVIEQEAPVLDLDGKELWFHSTIIPVKDENDRTDYLMVLSIETTKRKQAEEKLKLYSRVFSGTPTGVTITDAKKIIVDVNPAFCDITGYSREDVIGKNPSILSSGKQSSDFYQDMWQTINKQGHWKGEVWNRKKDGEIYVELLIISVLQDEYDKVVNYVGVFTDITSSKRQQEQLSFMAHYDVLTKLPNRALFTDRFAQAIAHSKRTRRELAICFIDLDDFKPVNDNYGHEVGDQLLVEVAERITFCIREEDTVSRQGGDEFALLLNDIESFSQCKKTLERIHYSLAQPYIIDGHSHKISASSGITLYPDDDADIDTLLRHADQAMYQAKLAGKHRYHLFNPEHDQRTIQKHIKLDEIEQALVNNEFQLYYQPKVNMVTGDVFGVEALIRWLHPEKGLIPPLDFLPIIDRTELELKLGNWVINEALSQLEIWQKQKNTLQVSINISSYHLLSEAFFIELETSLAQYPAVACEYLQLEILESSALSDLNTITTAIETCQEKLGVTVALDDFGTGYSSLTHLRSLPVDTIKIDRSFVRDMIDDPSDFAIIDGIIGLSDSFNRTVIAEGVETTNQGLMLLVMGCKEAQGYGIAKPMPVDDFPDWQKNYIPNKEWQACGNKHRTTKEKKVELFKLLTQRWKDVFINNIQSSPEEEVEHWPIMNDERCPCGMWIKRAIQEQLFAAESLKQLDKAHEALHLAAHALFIQYKNGETDAARNGLAEFQTAFDQMNLALAMCE